MGKIFVDRVCNLIDPLKCLNVQYGGERENANKKIEEYFDYNVSGFTRFYQTSDGKYAGYSDVRVPIESFDDEDIINPYALVVFGNPGEVHYSFRKTTTIKDCIDNNYNLLSFGIKTGVGLCFMKNYLNTETGIFTREQYIPDQGIIAKQYDFHSHDHLTDEPYYLKQDSLMLNSDSAFKYPSFCSERYNCGKIYVNQIEDGKYVIDIRDCDGRPCETITREGESLYSVYYDYMIEMGYFKKNNATKTK